MSGDVIVWPRSFWLGNMFRSVGWKMEVTGLQNVEARSVVCWIELRCLFALGFGFLDELLLLAFSTILMFAWLLVFLGTTLDSTIELRLVLGERTSLLCFLLLGE